VVDGNSFLLFYNQSTGNAFTALISTGSEIDALSPIGIWDKNWTQITSFVVGGNPFLLLYKESDGSTFTAPIISGKQVGPLTNIGTWDKDWALIGPMYS
jgi:hypothetical protein